MDKLYFCYSCKRVIEEGEVCKYCNSDNVGELLIGAPVNVIGTKTKGKILKMKDGMVRLLIRTYGNEKMIKEYKSSQLRKVI